MKYLHEFLHAREVSGLEPPVHQQKGKAEQVRRALQQRPCALFRSGAIPGRQALYDDLQFHGKEQRILFGEGIHLVQQPGAGFFPAPLHCQSEQAGNLQLEPDRGLRAGFPQPEQRIFRLIRSAAQP